MSRALLRMMLRAKRTLLDFPGGRKVDEGGKGEPVHPRLEAANAVAQPLRQHRDDPVREINAVAARKRLAIQRAAGAHVMRDIRDVDAQPPAAGQALDVDGVVKIARVVRIDGDDEFAAQILAPGDFARVDGLRNARGLAPARPRETPSADCCAG